MTADFLSSPMAEAAAPRSITQLQFQASHEILGGAKMVIVYSISKLYCKELAKDRLMLELAKQRESAADTSKEAMTKRNSLTAAAMSASIGAGIGVVMAIVMGSFCIEETLRFIYQMLVKDTLLRWKEVETS